MKERLLPDNQYFPSDYAYTDDMFDEDSSEMRKIKWIIQNKLTSNERQIFLLYTDHGGFNAARFARMLNTKPDTMRHYLAAIKKKIKYFYANIDSADFD